MFNKMKFFLLLCVLSSCSGSETKLDSPKNKDDIFVANHGKLFGDIEFQFPSDQKPVTPEPKEEPKK